MIDKDIEIHNRRVIVNALSTLMPEWSDRLESLKRKAVELASRPDVVWHMVVQSLSGQGNNRGYFNLIENPDNYKRIEWASVSSLSAEELLPALTEALEIAKVLWYAKKARKLCANYQKIQEMGGIDGARDRMNSLRGYHSKLPFFQQFDGIGDKYGRNIWMDLYDVDFRDSIAIDVRINNICTLIGINTNTYAEAEAALLEIANEAGRDGWEIDRLLFHFSDDFEVMLSSGKKIQRHKTSIRGHKYKHCSQRNPRTN